MKVRSNLSRNSSESLSSEDRASSPTTAFMAAVMELLVCGCFSAGGWRLTGISANGIFGV